MKPTYNISTDTRTLKQGDIYVALVGEHTDGHQYISRARELGASQIIIENSDYTDNDTILVPDTYVWYRYMAHEYRKSFSIPVIAIAGSNGKTTTKELLVACLQKKFNVHATLKNENNGIGIPKTLLGLTGEHEIAVIELGANEMGENYHLMLCLEPTHIYMTNHGKDHLAGYGDVEMVRKANNEVFEMGRYQHATVFVQDFEPTIKSDAWGTEQINFDPTITYNNETEVGVIHTSNGDITSQLFGAFNGKNMIAAYSIARYFGVSHDDCKTAIESYHPELMRGQVEIMHGKEIILDCYNANPSSMQLMIEHAIKHQDKKTSLLLGGMREMGEFSNREHSEMIKLLSVNRKAFDQVVIIGDEWKDTGYDSSFSYYESVVQAKPLLDLWDVCKNSARIIVKGSRGIALEKLLDIDFE